MNPQIGIAIPAYKSGKTLAATLRSCITQTRTDWIAKVTVDGPNAEVEEKIVDAFGDPRIHVEWNGGALGQFRNFNRATLRCHGAGVRWIKFLCSDDVLHPTALERMAELGDRSASCGLVFGYYNGIDAEGTLLFETDLSATPTRIVNGKAFFRDAIIEFNPIGGPSSVMIRADAVEHAGLFDDRLNYSGEAVLWYRLVDRYDVGIIGESPILDYRFHDNSITGRGKFSAARFNNPLDILREIAARRPPQSEEWRICHEVMGSVIAKNLRTCAGLAARGAWKSAVEGAATSLRRLSVPALLPAALTSLSIIRRSLVGATVRPSAPGSLNPPTRRIDATSSPSNRSR